MAGGAGTRLWPLSIKDRPKQLLRIVEGKSLLRLSFERVCGWLPAEHIHVIAGKEHIPLGRQEIPELPAANWVGEPCGRDTVNAIGLMAHLLHRADPNGVMGVLTADHVIRPVDRFRGATQRAFETAEQHPDALVTFGIAPTWPHTGLGYIHRGRAIAPGVYEVRRFREKPALDLAREYVASGEYLWNSGMFVWRASAFLAELARHVPESHEKLRRMADAPGDREALMRELYPTLPKISVDFAILEKAARVIVVELPCEWLDVGSWTALARVLTADDDGNVRAGGAAHRTLDAAGNILVAEGDHLIAAIGVRDLVIVQGPRATLVCRKEDAERIKDLVAGMQAGGFDGYL